MKTFENQIERRNAKLANLRNTYKEMVNDSSISELTKYGIFAEIEKVEQELRLYNTFEEMVTNYELALENWMFAKQSYEAAKEQGKSDWLIERCKGEMNNYSAQFNTMEVMAKGFGYEELLEEFTKLYKLALYTFENK